VLLGKYNVLLHPLRKGWSSRHIRRIFEIAKASSAGQTVDWARRHWPGKMASISGFSNMRFIEVLQAQMKRPWPENTTALITIVPYARPASEILGFG